MVAKRSPEMRWPPFFPTHMDIPLNMTVPQRSDHEHCQANAEYPGEKKVPAPTVRQTVGRGNGCPARKGPLPGPARTILPVAQETGCLDAQFAQSQIAHGLR